MGLAEKARKALEEHGPVKPGEHVWFDLDNIPSCALCGICKRKDGKNAPCKGQVRVTLRSDIGLRDKLYWRWPTLDQAHCFKKTLVGAKDKFVSLCGRETIERSGGQACCRPPAYMRCAICDGAEMNRREVDESMPDSPNWREARS